MGNIERLNLKKSLPPDVHLPNKNEAKELRRIMAETGLTEEEVRNNKTYRKQLAEASKHTGKKDYVDRFLVNLMKSVTKELKLPKEHPETLKLFFEKLEKKKKTSWYWIPAIVCYGSKDEIINRLKKASKK